jgi:hypothetical protein
MTTAPSSAAAAAQRDRRRHSGQQQAFGAEQPDDAQARGAEGGARRDLAPARRGPREHEVADIGAGQDQQQADGAEQQDDRSRQAFPNPRPRLDAGVDAEAPLRHPRVAGRRGRDSGARRVDLRGGDLEGRALAPPADQSEQHARLPVGQHRARELRDRQAVLRDRHPEIDGAGAAGAMKPGRRHADDGERVAVHQDRAAENVGRTGEVPAPEPVADDGDGRLAGIGAFGAREAAATRHRAGEDVEVRPGHDFGIEATRRAALLRHVQRKRLEAAERLERRRAAADRLVVDERDAAARALGRAEADGDETLLGAHAGQGPDDQPVGEVEHGGVGADPERKRQHRHRGMAAMGAQSARRLLEVGDHAVDRDSRHGFGSLSRSAPPRAGERDRDAGRGKSGPERTGRPAPGTAAGSFFHQIAGNGVAPVGGNEPIDEPAREPRDRDHRRLFRRGRGAHPGNGALGGGERPSAGGGEPETPLRLAAALRRRIREPRRQVALPVEPIERDVDAAPPERNPGARLDVVPDRHGIGVVAQPQRREHHQLLELAEQTLVGK